MCRRALSSPQGFLCGSCLLSGVLVPCLGFRLSKNYGMLLIAYYSLFMIMSILCEMKVLPWL